MTDLSVGKRREKLLARREPYWHKLATGQFLGFRPSKVGKGGTWIARYYDPETHRKPLRSLGDYGHLAPSDRFSAASKDAREWFRHLSHGGSEDDVTVGEACRHYAKDNADAEKRFTRFVYDDPIAAIKLRKLRKHHVKEWRARLAAKPALVTRNKNGRKVTRVRSVASVNRDMVPFRAALYAALERGEVETALAWKSALRPAETHGRRTLYLDKAQRRELLDALPHDAGTFCQGLCLLPLRPGALAALTVRDFDARTSTLTIERDKANGGRAILLPADTAAKLKAQTKRKTPAAPLFMRADGKAWNKDSWKGPIKEAARKAGLPEATTAYTLRHSTITDLVLNGLDLLTVARISGTSIRMIERHYGHLRGKHAAAALAGLAL